MIIYISTIEDLRKSIGVCKKIYSQIKCFSHYTSENVSLIATKDGKIVCEILTKDGNILKSTTLWSLNNIFEKAFYYKKLVDIFPKICFGIDSKANIAYLRQGLYDKYSLKLLQILKQKNFKIILEIPTSTFLKEYISDFPKGWYKFFFFQLYHKKVYQLTDLIVSIGEMSPVLKGYENKVLVISNGIDLSQVPMLEPRTLNNTLNLISVANVAYWHGYDRVIKGLGEYYRKKPERKVYFQVVGDGRELPKLKKLAERLRIEDYVIFHGTKNGEELNELFEKSHIGISSLGNHRKGMFKTSELKIREYCARGIPFICSSRDPDFPEDFEYMFKIPENESPVDIEAVLKWYNKLVAKQPDYPQKMRKYAEEYLTWEIKLKPLIERIENSS